ncbi:MAG: DUF2784 domain-containing protein [Bryobacterales bacterium]|nr:DUF2784 domain-containing protein [Bryobacteraceae bacterium]MDW8129060.1 DUF2784 domain-containing protein [Bryobacterales bacterium]
MGPTLFGMLALAALAAHLAFIVWVALGGAIVARCGGWPARLHLASLAYALVIQIGPWPCPLTLAEQYFQELAGREPYRTGFLAHYLERLVYPDLPVSWLIGATIAVCGVNLWLHVRSWRHARPR